MTTFAVSIRINFRPEHAGAIIDALAPVLAEAGLSFCNDAPGLIEGRNISPENLAILLDRFSSLLYDQDGGAAILASGSVDDLWVHVRRGSAE
ncbi:MAG: hypothetical protein KIS87_10470 [Phycisphaeraceae bacterium]|nr:hypothetical protein [Phycisphaeraceae bacterium]